MRVGIRTRDESQLPLSLLRFFSALAPHLRSVGVELVTQFGAEAAEKSVDVLWDPYCGWPLGPEWPADVSVSIPRIVTFHGAAPLSMRPQEYWGRVDVALERHFGVLQRLAHWREAFNSLPMSFVTPSRFGAKELQECVGVPGNRIVAIPHGIDHAVFNPDGPAAGGADEIGLLHVSVPQPKKNIYRLVEAYARLDSSRPPLTLIVPGISEGAVPKVDGIQVVDRILDSVELGSYYRGALAFVFPSLHETFGLPVAEAMACGCPVVAGSGSALEEWFGSAGLFFDPSSTSGLCQALTRIIQDSGLREALRAQGLKRASVFTWEAAARAYADVFARVASEGCVQRRYVLHTGNSERTGNFAGVEERSGSARQCHGDKREGSAVALLVAGMHRSGTSAVTRLFNLCGVALGSRLLQGDPANERGYWEHEDLWRLDERLLAALGRTWSDPRRLPDGWWRRPEVQDFKRELIAILRRDFGARPLWGVKDPRICRLLPLWRSAIRELGATEHFVIPLRRPAEVAASLARRDGMMQERAAALWLRHVLDAERGSRGAPRVFVSYDDLLDDWRSTLQRIETELRVGLAPGAADVAERVGEFLSAGLRHHRSDTIVRSDGMLLRRAEELYGALASSDSTPGEEDLDRLTADLDALEDAFVTPGVTTPMVVNGKPEAPKGISYQEWRRVFGLHESDGQVMAERMMIHWHKQPALHLIAVPVPGSPELLAATLDSLSTQLYAGWGLTVLAQESSPETAFDGIPNLEWRRVEGPVEEELLRAVEETESDWVALLRPGDCLVPQALFSCADRMQVLAETRLLYSDWDHIDQAGNFSDPVFERAADVDWLRTGADLGGLVLVRRDDMIELLRGGVSGIPSARSIALRVLEAHGIDAIAHIDEVLCHRAATRGGGPSETGTSEREGLEAHLRRVGEDAAVEEGIAAGTWRVRYPVRGEPRVSVIVETTDDLAVLERFAETLRGSTAYPNIELVVVDRGSREEDTFEYFVALKSSGTVIVPVPESTKPAEALNAGAAAARGEYLVFADRRVGFVQDTWLATLLGHAQRPGVGVVAPRIVDADGRVVHSALILGSAGSARDAFRGLSAWDPGYNGRALTEQGCSAVPPACFMVHRACFEEVGGFDSSHFPSDWFSVDFCLRAGATGYRTVWTPYALVGWQCAQPTAPAADSPEREVLYDRWLPKLARDPFYHRNLSLSWEPFELRQESTARWHPAFHERPRILGVPADTLGCGEYRILAPLNALDDAAVAQCGFLAPQEGRARMPSVTELARLEPDTLLLQAALDDVHLGALRDYRRFNQVFRVFDMEDLKTNVPEKNSRRRLLFRNVKARTREALSLCDRLIVTTEPLADEYRKLVDDIRVVPIYLSRKRWGSLKPARNEGPRPRVGWAGGQQHEGDLELLVPVVEATAREVDWVFMGMCPDALRPYAREVHGMVPFSEYPEKLASLALDVAVAPLEIHPFNVAKSNLRILEYGILGWPVVCTDIEPYRGAPVARVPNDPARWIEAIRERVHDLDVARSDGARLHQWVTMGAMLEDHTDVWLSALCPDGCREGQQTAARDGKSHG